MGVENLLRQWVFAPQLQVIGPGLEPRLNELDAEIFLAQLSDFKQQAKLESFGYEAMLEVDDLEKDQKSFSIILSEVHFCERGLRTARYGG